MNENDHASIPDALTEVAEATPQASAPQAALALLHAAAEKLRAELTETQQQLAEARENHLRTVADFDNAKKRLRTEAEQRVILAKGGLVEDLLPVLDNLERALAAGNSEHPLQSGVEMTARLFQDTLTRHGVIRIVAVGEMFDPARHEAIGEMETTEHAAGVIVEELQPGYLMYDRVLRASRVRVAKAPAETEE